VADDPQNFNIYRYDSAAADCSISLKFGTIQSLITSQPTQKRSRSKGQTQRSRSQHDVYVSAEKRY